MLTKLHYFVGAIRYAYEVLVYLYTYGLGGSEIRLIKLLKRLKSLGIEAFVIHRVSFPSQLFDAEHVSIPLNDANPALPRLVQIMRDLIILVSIGFHRVRYERIHVIYVNYPNFLMNVIPALIVGRILRRPVVGVFHHIDLHLVHNPRKGIIRSIRNILVKCTFSEI